MRYQRRPWWAVSVLVLTWLLVGSATAWAEDAKAAPRRPILWVVDTEPRIYLFGTMHVGDPEVLAHPPVLAHALEVPGVDAEPGCG